MSIVNRIKTLRERIGALPRVHLAHLSTPLEDANSLTRILGGPRILFKRDDLTGLPLSGNKTRMFEFSVGEALAQHADVVLATASVQSNYCRQLAAACATVGLKCHLVLRNVRGEADHAIEGNLLLALMAGANVRIIRSDVEERKAVLDRASRELRTSGYKHVFVCRDTDRHTATEAIAYVNAGAELTEQLSQLGIRPSHLYSASLCTTQAGLVVASKYLDLDVQIVGINPFGNQLPVNPEMVSVGNLAAEILNLNVSVSEADITSYSGYAERGYAAVTPRVREAIRCVAETEGIFLEPLYTGKAMAALMDDVESGRLTKHDTVVFLHTGGFPLLFSYGGQLDVRKRLVIDDQKSYVT